MDFTPDQQGFSLLGGGYAASEHTEERDRQQHNLQNSEGYRRLTRKATLSLTNDPVRFLISSPSCEDFALTLHCPGHCVLYH